MEWQPEQTSLYTLYPLCKADLSNVPVNPLKDHSCLSKEYFELSAAYKLKNKKLENNITKNKINLVEKNFFNEN
tara:strand:- start:3975 stop:4196 length:222 start_codon:yes stop_codon:yes gene_type:complete